MSGHWTRPRPLDGGAASFDPRFRWLRATGSATTRTKESYHGLLEFATPQAARSFARKYPRPADPNAAVEFWVPSVYATPPAGLENTRFCTGILRYDAVETLHSQASNHGIRRIGIGNAIERAAGSGGPVASLQSQAQSMVQRLPANSVVTGIIDDGLAIAHERFCRRAQNRLETRIEWFWDQVEPNANPNPNRDYGREYCKHDANAVAGIDSLLNQCRHGNLVDEDEFYRVTGLLDFGSVGHKPVAQRSSHGTHVMDLACGEDLEQVGSDRPIICVQLPLQTTADTSGSTLFPQVLDALWYIVEKAESLPLVINLSYGLFAGPHDGTGDLEAAIDDVIEERKKKAPTAVVLPAGNSHLARCHARFDLPRGASRALTWRVLPDDRTESIVEIWLPHGGAPKVKVRVTTPTGDASDWISEGDWCAWAPDGVVICWIDYSPQAAPRSSVIRITLKPTSSFDAGVPIAPCGNWGIEVVNDSGTAIVGIHAWIQRDDAPHRYPRRGRQSTFVDDKYERFELSGKEKETDDAASYIQRAGSINAVGTGKHSVVIGSFRRSDFGAAKYSAGGPIVARSGGQPDPRDGPDPDAMAVSEDSVACHGVLAAGSRSGSVVAINGTSVAAPRITRELVGIIATGVNPRQYAQNKARTQETSPPPRPSPPYKPKPSVERGGEGRIVLNPTSVRLPRGSNRYD